MSPTEIFLTAIAKRRILAFTYNGSARSVEPYILGHDDKGRLILSAVQRSGGSGSGFRTYKVEDLSALHLTELHFLGKHPDYNPRDPYFDRVLGKI
jgi:hypothetical protein